MRQNEGISERVRDSYDEIGGSYTAERANLATAASYLGRLIDRLLPGSTVLDIGCGAGVPIDRTLLEAGLKVIGIDISPKQIERARRLNPTGAYAVKGMLDLKPGDYEVDAVVAFFSIFHVPRAHHASLLKVLRSFLRTDGLLLITMGSSEDEGWDDFFGAEMYWSHYGPGQNRLYVEEARFTALVDELDTSAGERHQVLLARAI